MLHRLNVYERLYDTNFIPEQCAEPEFVNPCSLELILGLLKSLKIRVLLRSPGIDPQPGGPIREPY
jgi:hypothetical protein